MAFLLLGPLAPPGFAVIDIQGEIMRQVIDPCFLAAARQKKRNKPERYRGTSAEDLLHAMKVLAGLSSEGMSEFVADFEASADLESMTHLERFDVYDAARQSCIAAGRDEPSSSR